MGLILLRYGEIALKGQNRNFFFKRLRRNVRLCLKAYSLEGRVWQEGQRIYLETGDLEAAVAAVRRVFGLVSLSPVHETPAELDSISREAVAVAKKAGLAAGRSYRVRARRSDKSFPYISPEIERRVGARIGAATGARVDLSKNADVDIGVEVHQSRALVFGQTIPAPGGLPLGTQGRVVALLSSGIDSPVAAWLMMKRGCGVIPVHFAANQAQAEQVEQIVSALNRYAFGFQLRPIVLSHHDELDPILERLSLARAERWTCLFCKRALLARASTIASEMDASALVTGDSLGQVASQTLSNLEVISYGINKPIFRPLIGYDKTEIVALARQIGTYEASVQRASACPFLPDKPLTQGSIPKLLDLIDRMDAASDPAGASAAVKDARMNVYV